MTIEAVLLTGGASSRMGRDKSLLEVNGEPLAERTARLVSAAGLPVTVLGRQPIPGYRFQADEEAYEGPLVALSRFVPSTDYVLVLSCDLPLFDARVVAFLGSEIADYDAAVPIIASRAQPLCGLYCKEALGFARQAVGTGNRSVMSWLNMLRVKEVPEIAFMRAGLDPKMVRGANTPEELEQLLRASE